MDSGENPRDVKKELAEEIVTELYSKEDTQKAKEAFERTVQKKETPTEIPEFTAKEGQNIVDILVESRMAESKSDAKRILEQGGVEADGKRIDLGSLGLEIRDGMVIKVGKHKFLKLVVRN